MKKHIIFDNTNFNYNDYIQPYRECCDIQDDVTDDEIYNSEKFSEWVWDDLNFWYDAERANLGIEETNGLICIADLGFWYGRRSGYKLLGTNLNTVFNVYSQDEDYIELYQDENGELRGAGHHHDNSHAYWFREWKANVSEKAKQELCDKIYNDNFTTEDINKVTKKLAPRLKKIYGWA